MLAKAINLAGDNLNYNADHLKDASKIFSASCKFVIGITDYNLFPEAKLPEFAFIGRSNVGKSSLLNALIKQKSLARVSVTPGRTQQVNFFCLAEKAMLVDLPGYGFAKAPKNLVRAWERMSLGYIKNRTNLKRLFLLIDSRHGFKKSDIEFMEQLKKHGILYQIILTKLDKSNQKQIESVIDYARENLHNHPSMFQDIILSSSKEGYGLPELRTYVNDLL